MGYHDNAVLDSYAYQCNESHGRGDVECHAAHIECKHAAEESQRHDKHKQSGLPHFAKGEDKEDEHDHEYDGQYKPQSVEGAVAVLELAGPVEGGVFVVVLHFLGDEFVGLCHEGGEVGSAQVDTYQGVAAAHLAHDGAGSKSHLDVGYGREWHLDAVGSGEHKVANLLGCVAVAFGIAAGDVIDLAAYINLRDGAAADSQLNEFGDISHVETVLSDAGAVHRYLQLGSGRLLIYGHVGGTYDLRHDGGYLFSHVAALVDVVRVNLQGQVAVGTGYLVHHHVDDGL